MRAFKKNGLQSKVVMVGDGVEALDYMHGSGPFAGRRLPNLILLDLMLPRLNGFDVLRRMRSDEMMQLLPVVVLSSSLLPEDRLQAYRLGANSYVRKPVDFVHFSEVVKMLEIYWFDLNEGPPIDAELA
jgi:CheY-like chemotaxis protein